MAAISIVALLFVFAMGLLSKRSAQYREADLASASVVARHLSLAGLEDARVKLDNDVGFPPISAENQNLLTYEEVVYDLDSTTLLGSYQVTVDSTYATDPYYVLQLQSVGTTGPIAPSPNSDLPKARFRISAELDVSPFLRGTTSTPNPQYWRYINLREQSNY